MQKARSRFPSSSLPARGNSGRAFRTCRRAVTWHKYVGSSEVSAVSLRRRIDGIRILADSEASRPLPSVLSISASWDGGRPDVMLQIPGHSIAIRLAGTRPGVHARDRVGNLYVVGTD